MTSPTMQYLRHRNERGERPRLTRWSSPLMIDMIFMAHSSHLGQVLLRDQMPLPALFLNPDDAHTSDEENVKREFN